MITPNEFSRAVTEDNERVASSAAIRADIERTRERLGDTVEALGAQLNPSNLKQRVKDSVREATIGRVQHMASNTRDRITETGRSLAQTIRENPLPAAMAAAGLGWLILSSREQRPASQFTASRFTNGDPGEFAIPDESDSATGVRGRVRDVAENVADKAQDLTEKAQEATQRVVQKAKDTGDRVAQKARETGDRVADRADQAVHRVQATARNTARRVETKYEESPMGIGAVALALGLAIGLSVPSTRKEAELMGDARDKLVDKTRERLAETTEKVEKVVERALPEVQNVVREAARDEGLSG
jgi:ElaB/YqjD/DUF883 family membrane-anchored ribosome-binding protein